MPLSSSPCSLPLELDTFLGLVRYLCLYTRYSEDNLPLYAKEYPFFSAVTLLIPLKSYPLIWTECLD